MAFTIDRADINFPQGNRQMYYRAGTTDEAQLVQVFREGSYNLSKHRRFAEFQQFVARKQAQGLRPLFVDAGANIGAVTIYFDLMFPNSFHVCIEPVKSTFDLLSQNVSCIGARCLNAGLSGEPGELVVYDGDRSKFDSFRTASARGPAPASEGPMGIVGRVPAVTMDQILADIPAGTFPLLAKIDIEGAERDVFGPLVGRDSTWMEKFPLIIFEPHDWMMPRATTANAFLQCVGRLPRDFILDGYNIISLAHDLA
jgi:FkbM family methyltransferase